MRLRDCGEEEMSEKDDGGSAFPQKEGRYDGGGYRPITESGGLSLLDYFAAEMAAAFVSGSLIGSREQPLESTVARVAYHYADAMLAERRKRMEGK